MIPLSLSMLKMEKNFIAHMEKNYPRKPYEEYSIIDMIGFVKREQIELNEAMADFCRVRVRARLNGFRLKDRKDLTDAIINAMWEVADVSNTLDYLFEGLTQALRTWEGEK